MGKLSNRWFGLVTVSAIATITSCASPSTQEQTSEPATQQQSPAALQIVTTFLPMTTFTEAVAGDRAEVTQLLPANVSPHDYQAKPEDAQKLATADVLVENGLEMEEFLDDLVKNVGNTNLKTIDASAGITPIANGEADHDHYAEEKEKSGAEAHDHGEFNPHVWLDPKRAIQQVENIRDGLIAADPAGQTLYTANAAAYIAKLQQLDAELTQQLQPFAGKTFVTYHDFATYFADSYKLKVEYLVGIPEENPAPRDVKRVMDAARASNLKTLLTAPQEGNETFSALAKDLNVQVSYFDPLETAAAIGDESDYYLTAMRQNLKNLAAALGGKTP